MCCSPRSIAFAAMVLSCCARAQYIFEHLARADGLPGDQVLALHEDREGFIWMGTESGLARHEGVRIRTFFHDRKDPHSLSNDAVWDITGDEHGRVWVATDHGLCGYDARSGGFDRVFITPAYHDRTSANRIHRVVADGHGLLWLSTEDGIHVVSLDGDPHETDLPSAGSGIADLHRSLRAHGLAYDAVHDGVWIGSWPRMLFYGAKDATWHSAPDRDLPFRFLADSLMQAPLPDGNGGMWYFDGHTTQVTHVDAKGQRQETLPKNGDPRELLAPQFLRTDTDGRLWLSTWNHRLFTWTKDAPDWSEVRDAEVDPWGITSTNAKSWLQDRDGRIWIGTMNGINVLNPSQGGMRPFSVGPMGAGVDIACLLAPDDSTLFIGTEGEGIIVLDRRTGTQRSVRCVTSPHDENNIQWMKYPTAWSRDEDGWLVGTQNGFGHLDAGATRFGISTDPIGRTAGLASSTVTFIADHPDGSRWIGTWSDGLYHLTGKVAERFDGPGTAGLHSKEMLSCAIGSDGVWVGMNNGAGLCRIEDGRVVEHLLASQDSTDAGYGVVRALAEAKDGTLYIGTLMGGLGLRDPANRSITWFTRSDGLTGDRIEQLVLDNDDNLWIRTNIGLCRMDGHARSISRIALPGFVRGDDRLSAISLDTDGSLLCAMSDVVIDLPASIGTSSVPPEVAISSIRIAGTTFASWKPDSTITLAHDQRTLSIEFAARSFFSAQEVRFAYRIVDIDTTWRGIGTSSRLDLNDLPRGDHRLEVRANNGGSPWTKTPLSLDLRVLPPFWATWWFRGALLSGIGAALYFFVRAYVNERLREQRELHERVQAILAERMRIAGDMHDDLGAGLSALKLKSEMALRVEKDPLKREQLGMLANTAGDLIGSMRQIIWTMNADQASVEDLVVYTTSYARNYCTENGLAITVKADGPWPAIMLSTEQRRNVFLVVKEALHNTVKHAQATSVELGMRWVDGVQLELKDNGVGLAKGTENAVGNGLRNMRKRITSLGGTMNMNGEQGTCLRFKVPIGTPP